MRSRSTYPFVVTSLSLALGACADVPSSAVDPSRSESDLAASGLKPQLGGLLNRHGPWAHDNTALSGFVSEQHWDGLEPTQGRYDFSAIDRDLAAARAAHQHIKLRVYQGVMAPAWAKHLGGAPFPFYAHNESIGESTLGHFWSAPYQAAWAALQGNLAARYDGDATLSEVELCGLGTASCEVMLIFANDRNTGGVTNGQSLVRNGYSETARRTAMQDEFRMMASVWTHTRLSLTSHPWQSLDASGSQHSDLDETEAMDRAFIAAARPHQASVFHTGLGPDVGGTGQQMYDWIVASGFPFDLQTETFDRLGNQWQTSLEYACDHGVMSVELPTGWSVWPTGTLSRIDTCLAHNATLKQ